MKKSLVIFGLFSLMMVLTSFTSPVEIGGKQVGGMITSSDLEIGGGKQVGGMITTMNLEIGGGKQVGGMITTLNSEIGGGKQVGGI